MPSTTDRITRDQIEAKLRKLAGEVDDEIAVARPKILSGAIAGLVLVALVAYLLGRRGGTKRSAIVEIRRL